MVNAHYRRLIALGREDFLAATAPAVLVRIRGATPGPRSARQSTEDETLSHGNMPTSAVLETEILPLAKKPGASFPDRITIGRTTHNDVVVDDHSISRLHAYIAHTGGRQWVVADAGSKNGSWLRGVALEARREQPIASRMVLRLGDVELTFYDAADLYAELGGE